MKLNAPQCKFAKHYVCIVVTSGSLIYLAIDTDNVSFLQGLAKSSRRCSNSVPTSMLQSARTCVHIYLIRNIKITTCINRKYNYNLNYFNNLIKILTSAFAWNSITILVVLVKRLGNTTRYISGTLVHVYSVNYASGHKSRRQVYSWNILYETIVHSFMYTFRTFTLK